MRFRYLWIAFFSVVFVSFAVLGYYGYEIYRQAPPIPKQVVTESGKVLMTAKEIKDGQNVWQSMGGQQVGSIWGHGAYVAPDWSADWLHREAEIVVESILLPVGLLQSWASLNEGLWYARSADFLQTDLMQNLRWARVLGDTIFAVGVVALGYFVFGLYFGWSREEEGEPLIDPQGGVEPVVGK